MMKNDRFILREKRLAKVGFLVLGLVLSACFAAPMSSAEAAVGCGPNTYREDPRVRKQKSQTALFKAMELNAKVAIMMQQGSDQNERMIKMLSDSYGYQIVAITQMEGVVRESCFKDPLIEWAIKNMYEQGKPATLRAESKLRNGDPDILGELESAKQTHQRFLLVTY